MPIRFTYSAAPGLRRISTASVPEKYQTACTMLAKPGRIAPNTEEIGMYAKLNPQKITPQAAPSVAPTAISNGCHFSDDTAIGRFGGV